MFPPRRSRLRPLLRALIGTARIIMNSRPMSKEQEEMLAKIAMSERMLMKHWRWLEHSGLINQRRARWGLTKPSLFYIEMITQVHGPHMPKDLVKNWWYLLRCTQNQELISKFWSWHLDEESWLGV